MKIKIINNDADYNEALEMLSNLLQKDSRTLGEENALGILLLVIKDFEEKNVEPFDVDPIDAIKFRMDQMNLRQKDLIPYLGSLSKISEVLNGKRPLSLSMIRKLNEGLEIPLESLIGVKKVSELSPKKLDYSLFPLVEMQNRGYLGNTARSTAELKEYSEEIISDFSEEYSDILEQNIALLRAPLHRRGKKKLNMYSLSIWQICVLKKVALINEKIPKFNRKCLDEKWLRTLMTFSRYDDGHILAKGYLKEAGIFFIIEPHFKKTFLDGAALMYEGKPIVALTMRHDRIDNFWFVLAHELAHLMKHIDEEKSCFFIDDNLDECEQLDEIEKEADLMANEALIPSKLLEKSNILKASSYLEIEKFAKIAQVNPAIIVGRIRHHRNNFALFPKLVKRIAF